MSDIKIIAELGINCNSSMDIAKKLIQYSAASGFNYVKFQKREPDLCVPEEQKNLIKDTPWGKMSYLDYKHKIEFNMGQLEELNDFANLNNIRLFASAWDLVSAENIKSLTDIVKVPSALINDTELLTYCRDNFKTVLMSTGMSIESEIEQAVKIGNPDVIFHCNASYPADVSELNLLSIQWLKEKYPDKDIGYSGHEYGLATTFAAVPLGVKWIERHVTLSHDLWGSDQKASIEPSGMVKLVKGIRDIEKALGKLQARELYPSEEKKRKSLRK